jgi:hypothetical protein
MHTHILSYVSVRTDLKRISIASNKITYIDLNNYLLLYFDSSFLHGSEFHLLFFLKFVNLLCLLFLLLLHDHLWNMGWRG